MNVNEQAADSKKNALRRDDAVLSIIIPAYNEEDNIANTIDVVSAIMQKNAIPFELVFVDDGSADKTWLKLCEMSAQHDFVTAVRFSRNFGKEGAIFAGLKAAAGDACVVMDCDLQHPPAVVVDMYKLWKYNDFDVVEARKSSRGKEGLLYKCFAKSFYKLLRSTSGLNLDGASDFKLMDRRVVDSLNEMPERLTFFRALSSWVGYKTTQIYFDVAPRANGTSKWSFRKLFAFAVNSITSFSNLPMQIVTFCGVLFFLFSIIMAINTLYNKLTGNSEAGFSTVILLLLITGSIIMFSLGIIGHYLSKIYEEIKYRPRYIIADVVKSKTFKNRQNREDNQ